MIGASVEEDPVTVKEAKERSDWLEWKTAMDTKIMQLEKHGTFKLVELTKD